jgi:hypothetical protein
VTKRRKFFEDYAEANNFDPLIPENWYSQPTDKVRATKVREGDGEEDGGGDGEEDGGGDGGRREGERE